MKIMVAPVAFVLLAGLLSGVTACSKDKPKHESKPAQVAPPPKPAAHISERSYSELFRLLVNVSPETRREAMARDLLLFGHKIYGKEINEVLGAVFDVSPDKRQEFVARELSPIFNEINRGAWHDLAMVSPHMRPRALLQQCVVNGKPLVDPSVADYAEFEYLLLAMAMAYEAGEGGFEDANLHRLALAAILEPEWFLLYPPPGNGKEEIELPFEPIQPLSVTLTPTSIRLGADLVADVACRIGDRDCTKDDLEELDRYAFEPESAACAKASLKVPLEFRDNLDAESLNIASLERHFRVRTARKAEALDLLGWRFEGRGTLFVHPVIPYRLIVETIYTMARAGFPGEVGLNKFRLRTHPRSFELGVPDRTFGLPKFSPDHKDESLVPVVLVKADGFLLRLVRRAGAGFDAAAEFVLPKKKQPVCGSEHFREEYDYAGLYTKLVELRSRRESDLSETIQLGAEPGIPWHVVSKTFDTVASQREKDSYTDHCELLAAPVRTERRLDSSGDAHSLPMGLFPGVALVIY